MPRFNTIKNSLLAGELSPRAAARTDLPHYAHGAELMENMVTLPLGGGSRRTGSKYVTGTNGNLKSRLIPISFSNGTRAVIELNATGVRLIFNDDSIVNLGAAYSFTPSELDELQYAQSGNAVFIVHPNYLPFVVYGSFAGGASYGLKDWNQYVVQVGGKNGLHLPYRDINVGPITLTPSATTGSITLTASGGFFTPQHVGSYIKINQGGANTAIVQIVSVTNTLSATAFVHVGFSSTAASSSWQEAAWSAVYGYPRAIGFFQNRLIFGGTTDQPDTIFCSRSANFVVLMQNKLLQDATTNVSGANYFGPISAGDATVFTLAAQEVSQIQWIVGAKTLTIGTAKNEYVGTSVDATVAPDFRAESSYGSAFVQSRRSAYTQFYVQNSGRLVREMQFEFTSQSYVSQDMNLYADHIADRQNGPSYINQLAIQQQKGILWAVTAGGALLSLSREKQQDQRAWNYHSMGGSFAGKTSPVLSVCVIQDASTNPIEIVYLCVQRTINGTTTYTIEKLMPDFLLSALDDAAIGAGLAEPAYYLDCSIKLTSGSATTTFTGIAHLHNETVSVFADGYYQGEVVVSNTGGITIPIAAKTVVVGYKYKHRFRAMRFDGAGAALGTAEGAIKRIDRVVFLLDRAIAMKTGRDSSTLEDINFLPTNYVPNSAIPFFTGEYEMQWQGDYDRDGYVYVEGDKPYPFTLLGLVVRGAVNEQ